MAGAAHQALLRLYQHRFGVMPPEAVRARMQTVSDPEVLSRWCDIVAFEPQEIVDRALTGTQP